MQSNDVHSPDYADPQEINMVAFWLRRDPARWFGGAVAGVIAGAIALGVGGLLSASSDIHDFWFPAKLLGTIVAGSSATEFGNMAGMIQGLILWEVLTAISGAVYSHFVFTHKFGSLAAMGLVWGVFTWIFWWNLYLQSFKPIFAAQIPSGAVFLVCMIFGLCLSVLGIISPKRAD